jgi:hypothetical protein
MFFLNGVQYLALALAVVGVIKLALWLYERRMGRR